jgi:hypothetical protein
MIRRPTGPGGGSWSRPPAFDRERYRQRNQFERLMNRRKQFRAVATRFDKLAVRYQATIAVADIFIWLRARPDQPRGDPRTTPEALGFSWGAGGAGRGPPGGRGWRVHR